MCINAYTDALAYTHTHTQMCEYHSVTFSKTKHFLPLLLPIQAQIWISYKDPETEFMGTFLEMFHFSNTEFTK